MKNALNFLLKLFVFVILVSLSYGFYFLNTKIETLAPRMVQEKAAGVDEVKDFANGNFSQDSDCGEGCKEEIAKEVSKAVATLSGTKVNTVIREVQAPSSSVNTTYIGLGTIFTTTSTSWVDVPDSAVYVDLEKDYGLGATVSWEAQLKVAHGNGKAFARLFDDTNKIAVDFSELSTENNVSYKQVSSGNLPFWKGRNLYKVQVKSLNSFEVTYSSGRIKVSY